MESGHFQGKSVDRSVNAQNWVVSLGCLRLEGLSNFPLFQSLGGNDEKNQAGNDAERDSVKDEMRVHWRLIGVVQSGGQSGSGGRETCPALTHSPK